MREPSLKFTATLLFAATTTAVSTGFHPNRRARSRGALDDPGDEIAARRVGVRAPSRRHDVDLDVVDRMPGRVGHRAVNDGRGVELRPDASLRGRRLRR